MRKTDPFATSVDDQDRGKPTHEGASETGGVVGRSRTRTRDRDSKSNPRSRLRKTNGATKKKPIAKLSTRLETSHIKQAQLVLIITSGIRYEWDQGGRRLELERSLRSMRSNSLIFGVLIHLT